MREPRKASSDADAKLSRSKPSPALYQFATETFREISSSPVGAGHQHRLTCGCNILAGPYAPVEIKWCPTHAAASEMLYELGAINDALVNDIDVVIQPGSVRHARIQKVVDKADARLWTVSR